MKSACVPGQHFSLRQLGICEPPPPRRGLAFCSDVGLPHRGFSVGAAQDLDADSQAVMSPERAMRLWGRGGLGKPSGRSSCLSSRSNSVLTLTDTEHENKSDSDNGRTPGFFWSPVGVSHISSCIPSFTISLSDKSKVFNNVFYSKAINEEISLFRQNLISSSNLTASL